LARADVLAAPEEKRFCDFTPVWQRAGAEQPGLLEGVSAGEIRLKKVQDFAT
jgi:hypothetical protein